METPLSMGASIEVELSRKARVLRVLTMDVPKVVLSVSKLILDVYEW